MKVFLSYASEDRGPAHVIADALRDDGHDVYPADHWPMDVRAAMKRAEAFVVLLSPAALSSPYVNEEIRQALVLERFADRVIPVILRPSPHIPWILQTMQPIPADPSPKTAAHMINERLQRPDAADSTAR
ncbi:MAG TPA: toll/interleukin-1 receptor domain-containing protein [Vicinamibacterales bacterium]|nr:toll/interleukin-1 receptor domain-containing protein [Vicinamibacterales bacterium]